MKYSRAQWRSVISARSTPPAVTCSKSTIETLKQGEKYVQS